MAAKKSYNRFFIIFQEEDRGYGIGPGRPPTGYVKVETKSDKGKVTVYVQNLKPFDNGECLYKCYLISHKDGKDNAAYLGIMNIDEFGRGESSWESGADNAFDTKVSIDKFNAAAIVVDKEGISSVVAPLAGYMSKEKFEWRDVIPVPKAKVEEPVEVEAEELSDEGLKFDQYEQGISGIADAASGAEVFAEAQGAEEAIVEEARLEENAEAVQETETVEVEAAPVETREETAPEEVVEPQSVPVSDDVRGKHKHYHENKKKKHDPYGHMHSYSNYGCNGCMGYPGCMAYQGAMGMGYPGGMGNPNLMGMANPGMMGMGNPAIMGMQYPEAVEDSAEEGRELIKDTLEDILEDYEEILMDRDLPGCKMWKIDMDKYNKECGKMYVYPCYDLIFFPMLQNTNMNLYNYIRKHGHYIFGIQYGRKGKNDRQASRALRRLVFGIPGANTPFDQPFQGMTGFTTWVPSGRGNKDIGYWIMMYDPMTGMVGMDD